MNAGRSIALWGPVLAAMGVLFALSSQPSLPGVERIPDKLLHASAYFLLGLLSLRAAHGGFRAPRPLPTLLSFVLCLGYGAIEEWHQAAIPTRDASVGDWIADGVGLGAAWILLRLAAVRGGARGGRSGSL